MPGSAFAEELHLHICSWPLFLLLLLVLLAQDLAVKLGAPPASYCFVFQTELSAVTKEQVTSFKARNVPLPYWELD